jgi:phage shock protein E
MKQWILPILLLFALVSCGEAQQSNGNTNTVQKNFKSENISVEQFKELIKDPSKVTILDVRTDKECNAGMIPGAVQLDYYKKKEFKDNLAKLPKDKPVLIYCAVGGRSSSAIKDLQEAGFTTVYNLNGGMDAWKDKKMPLKQ